MVLRVGGGPAAEAGEGAPLDVVGVGAGGAAVQGGAVVKVPKEEKWTVREKRKEKEWARDK